MIGDRYKKNRNYQNNTSKVKGRGFTLIEMLITIAIFTAVIGIISGIFISGIREQRRALALRALIDQTSYALEYMSRGLRLSLKQITGLPPCLSRNGLNYELTHGEAGIKFINHLQGDDCQEFFLENSRLKYRRKIGLAQEETLDLTSDKLEVTALKFVLWGESQDDDYQPKVTILLNIKGKGAIEGQPELKIQTTLSQRNLDVAL